jgi:hypothetical protein
MSFARRWHRGPTETEVRALMKVLIGVDPHKASVAVAAVAEAAFQVVLLSPYHLALDDRHTNGNGRIAHSELQTTAIPA